MKAVSAADVCVIVCSYSQKRWDDLDAAVQSLQAQEVVPGEIIVVIDHNAELKARAIRSLQSVTIIENSGQQGLSDARNTGVRATEREIIAFVDDDATVDRSWLSRLLPHYDDPGVIGVGGSAEPLWAQARPSWFPEEFDWVVGCSYRGMPEGAAPVRNLLGCNMSFRRRAFEVAGDFDARIGRVKERPLGGEETEFCIRLHRALPEMRLVYEPMARVRHRVPIGRAKWSYYVARCYAEGLSKASISHTVGRSSALESERRYTRNVLPAAVGRNALEAIRVRDLTPLGRSLAVIVGLMVTTAGYLRGSVAQAMGRS